MKEVKGGKSRNLMVSDWWAKGGYVVSVHVTKNGRPRTNGGPMKGLNSVPEWVGPLRASGKIRDSLERLGGGCAWCDVG